MTPSRSIVQDAAKTKQIADKTGRRLLIRKPTALDTLRLFKAAGPALAQNEPWLSMAALAWAVLEVDGVPAPALTSESQIESMIERLGNEGLTAVAENLDLNAEDARVERDELGN
jgi:hypothetical protein